MDRTAFDHRFHAAIPEIDKRGIRQDLRRSIEANAEEPIPNNMYDLIIAIEELAELQKTLTKALRGRMDRVAITEEIADVSLGIMRIQEICGIPTNDIYKAINVKAERLNVILNTGRKYR